MNPQPLHLTREALQAGVAAWFRVQPDPREPEDLVTRRLRAAIDATLGTRPSTLVEDLAAVASRSIAENMVVGISEISPAPYAMGRRFYVLSWHPASAAQIAYRARWRDAAVLWPAKGGAPC